MNVTLRPLLTLIAGDFAGGVGGIGRGKGEEFLRLSGGRGDGTRGVAGGNESLAEDGAGLLTDRGGKLMLIFSVPPD